MNTCKLFLFLFVARFVSDCEIVDDFLEACKKKLSPLFDSVATAQLSLSSTEGGTPLQPDDLIPAQNTAKTPLFISVAVSEQAQKDLKLGIWRVSGTILVSLAVKGVRAHMYLNADNHLGYYESRKPAFVYEENSTNISINVLFKTEENALRFDSHLRHESITINSPRNSLRINSGVVATTTAQLGERIYYNVYIPIDSESPQETRL
jgi:hypothetical protein